MIAFLKGKKISVKPTKVIVDVNGVGYEVAIPLSTYEKISSVATIELYIAMIVRENSIALYGFSSEEEKQMFAILTSIPGIGPSIAISILSSMSPHYITNAVKAENILAFTAIPGIGKSKSEKIIFELKRKLRKLEGTTQHPATTFPDRQDAIDALVSLGFDEKLAMSTISSIITSNPDCDLETIIRLSLKQLSQ
ncbi:MAG TPA: Holliday junction branch migration protein RuvA [Spirochaetota bacterium]|nr:Holliday junction branch migration protein RuvA [Spirochaetota bacterium]